MAVARRDGIQQAKVAVRVTRAIAIQRGAMFTASGSHRRQIPAAIRPLPRPLTTVKKPLRKMSEKTWRGVAPMAMRMRNAGRPANRRSVPAC